MRIDVRNPPGAAASHTHVEGDVTSLTSDLGATEKTANKGANSGYAGLDANGRVAQSPKQHDLRSGSDHSDSLRTSDTIAESFPRYLGGINQAITSGTLYLGLIWLPAQAISNIVWQAGTTGLTNGTSPHAWSILCSVASNTVGAMVASSADNTAAAWSASGEIVFPIATIASGVSSTYTPASAGWYYAGLMINAGSGGTMPTLDVITGRANKFGLANGPKIAVSGNTGQTTARAFAFTPADNGALGFWPTCRVT